MNEAVGDRLDPAVAAIGISRRPIARALDFARLNRSIADRRAREAGRGKGERVNERLERRADLAIRRRQGAIEFALRIIASADERADAAARIIDRDERAFEVRHRVVLAFGRGAILRLERMVETRLALDFGELLFDRVGRGFLHDRIERGVNEEAAVVDLIGREERG